MVESSSGVKQLLKSCTKPAIAAFFVWFFLNVSTLQGMFFKDASLFTIVFVKAMHLIFLFLLMYLIFSIVRKSKTDKRYKDLMIIAGIYFLVLMILLILVWPGAWAWDDLGVIYGAQFYNFTPWQHFLSGLFQVLSLQTLPFASGVIIMQIFLASIMVGYIVSFLGHAVAKGYKKNPRWARIIIFVPFFFLPVLFYVLTGYRMAIYQYLEILVFVMIMAKWLVKEKITYQWLILLGCLTVLVGAWRTEGLLIVVFVPIMLICLKNSFFTKKRLAVFFVATLGAVLLVGKINTVMIGNDNYKIGAIIYPLLVNVREGGEINEEEKEKIGKVIDLECMEENTDLTEELIYHNCMKSDYSEEEYSAFFKEAIAIIVKHPKRTIIAIWDMFWKTSSGAYEEGGNPYARTTAVTAANIFTDGTPEKELWDKIDSRKKMPINNELRTGTINFLAGTPDFKAAPYYSFFWNHFIPIILAIIVAIVAIVRKKWMMLVAELAILGRVVAIALTAMAPYFMYYMPVYVSSYVLFAFMVVDLYYSSKKGVSLRKGVV